MDVSEIQTTRINIEPFILAVYPKVGVMDVATRRFGILDREQQKAQIEMAKVTPGHLKCSHMLETPKAYATN